MTWTISAVAHNDCYPARLAQAATAGLGSIGLNYQSNPYMFMFINDKLDDTEKPGDALCVLIKDFFFIYLTFYNLYYNPHVTKRGKRDVGIGRANRIV